MRATNWPSQALNAASWRPADMDVQVADLLAQRVAVEPQYVGRLELIAAGRRQGSRDQRSLDLANQSIVDARRRQGAVVGTKIAVDVALDGVAETVVGWAPRRGSASVPARAELQRDHVLVDRFLGVEDGQSAHEVLEFADIPGPRM